MRRDEVLEIILATKVIAVIRMADSQKLIKVAEAIEQGGVRALEITMTTPSALEIISTLSQKKAPGMLIGAGTVLDVETATQAIHAGADFVVSPVLRVELIRTCRRYDVFVAAGAFTPTEILTAWEKGADVVKVFPATSVGPKYFQDIKGPFPQIRLMPTGGVNLENAREFIRSGACCVAIGTALLDKRAIENDDWGVLTQKAAALMDSLR